LSAKDCWVIGSVCFALAAGGQQARWVVESGELLHVYVDAPRQHRRGCSRNTIQCNVVDVDADRSSVPFVPHSDRRVMPLDHDHQVYFQVITASKRGSQMTSMATQAPRWGPRGGVGLASWLEGVPMPRCMPSRMVMIGEDADLSRRLILGSENRRSGGSSRSVRRLSPGPPGSRANLSQQRHKRQTPWKHPVSG